jgi:hypothetical protein
MKFKITNAEMVALISIFIKLVAKYKNASVQNAPTLDYINCEAVPAEDMLYLAIFEEMLLNLQCKAIISKPKYSIKFSPVQAIAFWIEFNGLMNETNQLGNRVQIVCNQIHNQILAK